MIFNTHSQLEGKHAILSASKYHWMNYDAEKMARVFYTAEQAAKGTALHLLAHMLIVQGVKLERRKKTLNMYVNDCIGYRMTPERVLKATDNAFGTPDAIAFRNNTLRISDLKTGTTPASIHQLEIYAAFFCMEYKFKPHDIAIELRIYQNNHCDVYEADPDVIAHVMDKIIVFDTLINTLKEEALL